MGGAESLGISTVGHTVLARLMGSQIWYQLASSVGERFRKGTMVSAYLDARHLVSPCITLVPFKLLPRCWSSGGVSLSESVCGFFKRNCLGLQKFLPQTQSLLVFAARSCGTYLPVTGTLGWGPGVGLGLLTPELSLLNFYPPHVGEGPAHSTSVPLLPVWVYVVFLILWL